jgi:hypothetical protein
VLLEQSSDPILTLTNQALVRLMSFTVLASVVVALGLLGAAWLSLRVRRLAHAPRPRSGRAGDPRRDAGRDGDRRDRDLARSFAQLLARLREHTDYLRTLSRKLSHEPARRSRSSRRRSTTLLTSGTRPRRTSISVACAKAPTGSTRSSPR